jgi:phage shock protein E
MCSKKQRPIRAQHALMQEEVVVLDVRTGLEFKSGHLDDAINIPVSELEARVGELPEDPSTPILVYCRSGGRSARAKLILEQYGYTDVTDGGALKSLTQSTLTK